MLSTASTDKNEASPAITLNPASSRLCRNLLAALIFVCLLSYCPMISGEFLFNQFNHDDTESYIALGNSLANGRGYTRSLDPAHYVPHQHFPPGFPLLLAVCFLLSPSLLLPQLLIIACSLLNPVLFWLLARRWIPDWLA